MKTSTHPVRVMVDTETLGVTPGSAIVSIGAVKFSLEGMGDTFYERIDLRSCTDAGLTIDTDTIKWWLGQSDAARAELVKPDSRSLNAVLMSFSEWLNTELEMAPAVEIWGNGANFDNNLLAAAYRAIQHPVPWKFWNDRCYRTVKALHPDLPLSKRTGTHHNALDDAISQAEHLITLPSFRAMCEMETALERPAGMIVQMSAFYGTATGRFSATEENPANVKKGGVEV